MAVLVTAATACLGRARAAARGQRRGVNITLIHSRNCDLTDPAALEAFPHRTYDVIFHLAAWTQAGEFCLHHPGEQWIINQRINTNLLAWWHTNQPHARLVCIG